LKPLHRTLFTGFAGSRAGFTFHNRHLASSRAQLLNNKVGAFFTYCDIVGSNERLNVATRLFQTGTLPFHPGLPEDPFYMLSRRLHQVHRGDWRKRDPFIVLVQGIFEQQQLSLHIAFRRRSKDVDGDTKFLSFFFDASFMLTQTG